MTAWLDNGFNFNLALLTAYALITLAGIIYSTRREIAAKQRRRLHRARARRDAELAREAAYRAELRERRHLRAVR